MLTPNVFGVANLSIEIPANLASRMLSESLLRSFERSFTKIGLQEHFHDVVQSSDFHMY